MIEYRLRLQSFLDDQLRGKSSIKILEAGCGSRNNFSFGSQAHFSGIDISEKQLNRNKELDVKILGNLETYDLGEDIYDVIMCWNVLEHLEKPLAALKNLLKALKEGGIIIIGIPNVMSVKGLATKFLPHSAHVSFYRYIMGRENAGKDDVGPFKTYLKFDISVKNISKFAALNNAEIIYYDNWDAADLDYYLNKNKLSRIVKQIYRLLLKISKILSFGNLRKSESIFVLKRYKY